MSRLFRFADLIAYKYKFAAEPTDLQKQQEKKAKVRLAFDELWNLTQPGSGLYGEDLRDMTTVGLDPDSKFPADHRAQAGAAQKLLIKVLNILDVLKTNLSKMEDFSDLRRGLATIILDLSKIAEKEKDGLNFPPMTYLVQLGVLGRTVYENEKLRKQKQPKVRKGLEQILRHSRGIINLINFAEGLPRIDDPDKKHRSHQPKRDVVKPGDLDDYDVMPFMRQYGLGYGIADLSEWAVLFREDPELKREISKTIHAIERGLFPRNDAFIRHTITQLLDAHKARQANNGYVFEAGEDQFREMARPKYVSQDQKEQLLERRRQLEQAKQEEEAKWDEARRKNEEAHQRHRLENAPSEEENKDKFGSLRLKQILKRYQ